MTTATKAKSQGNGMGTAEEVKAIPAAVKATGGALPNVEQVNVAVAPIPWAYIDLVIESEEGSALVVHKAPTKQIIQAIKDKEEGGSKKKTPKDTKAKEKADPNTYLYLDSEGRHCILTVAVKNAMVRSAAGEEDEWETRNLLKRHIRIMGNLLPLVFPQGTDLDALGIVTEGLVKKPGGRSVSSTNFQYQVPWQCPFRLWYRPDKFSLKEIVDRLQEAGQSMGVGVGRPECGGDNGRFRIGFAQAHVPAGVKPKAVTKVDKPSKTEEDQ